MTVPLISLLAVLDCGLGSRRQEKESAHSAFGRTRRNYVARESCLRRQPAPDRNRYTPRKKEKCDTIIIVKCKEQGHNLTGRCDK
jgi:hypothetical protein